MIRLRSLKLRLESSSSKINNTMQLTLLIFGIGMFFLALSHMFWVISTFEMMTLLNLSPAFGLIMLGAWALASAKKIVKPK